MRIMPNLAAAIGKSPMALFGQGLDDAGRAQVTELLSHISLGLKVFIGKGTTARLVADIWQVLSAGE